MDRTKDERVMSLLDSFLEEHKDEIPDMQELGTVPMDYVSTYLDTPSYTPQTQADNVIRSKTEQLLDAFLSSGQEPIIQLTVSSDDAGDDENGSYEADDEANRLEDTYYTETLARIYLKQRRYDKALEIIRSLYLNFPNKSIYFADQIRYLEKLVRINQK